MTGVLVSLLLMLPGSHLDRIVSPLEKQAKEKLHLLYYLL
jgi:hypothetical protein